MRALKSWSNEQKSRKTRRSGSIVYVVTCTTGNLNIELRAVKSFICGSQSLTDDGSRFDFFHCLAQLVDRSHRLGEVLFMSGDAALRSILKFEIEIEKLHRQRISDLRKLSSILEQFEL